MNERGAGRKRALTTEQINEARRRIDEGSTVTSLASEYHVSRQTMSGYLNSPVDIEFIEVSPERFVCRALAYWAKFNKLSEADAAGFTIRMDYMYKDEVTTSLFINPKEEKLRIANRTDCIIHRAFGANLKPAWTEFESFLEERCFPRTRMNCRKELESIGLDTYDPLSIITKTSGRMAEDSQWIRIYSYVSEEYAL